MESRWDSLTPARPHVPFPNSMPDENTHWRAPLSQMKSSAIKKLRKKLAADEPVYGLWVTLESASISEMAVALGLDWIVVDAEHGHLDWKEILEHIRVAVRSDTVVLVRIAGLNAGLIK